MHADFWHQRWLQGQIGFHQETGNLHLRELWHHLGLRAGQKVFVPLCGKSVDMVWLAERGHPVLGVELSPLAVEEFFREHGLEPRVEDGDRFRTHRAGPYTLLCGDFFALHPQDLAGVAGVYDRASLIALPATLRRDYARHLYDILPGAGVLLVTLEYPEGEIDGPPYTVPESEVEDLFREFYAVQRLRVHDALEEAPELRARGLSRLTEEVFLLSPLQL